MRMVWLNGRCKTVETMRSWNVVVLPMNLLMELCMRIAQPDPSLRVAGAHQEFQSGPNVLCMIHVPSLVCIFVS